jgi:diguanylate cyclase (GGDEF)-like protein/PAS domain S-box-containing protein
MPSHAGIALATILLIQDDETGAQTVRDALAHSCNPRFEVEWLRSCAGGLARLATPPGPPALDSGPVSAVLVDLLLPDVSGLASVDQLYRQSPQVPIVVLSSLCDEATGRSAIQHGAQDFLVKERLDDYVLPKMLAAVIERASIANALHEERERAQVTLNSIGDAVISTDVAGKVVFINAVAERLTGWGRADALGRPLEAVFRIVDGKTRATIPNPMNRATSQNAIVSLPASCILVRRDGSEAPIEDSAAPIHSRNGAITGAVMVFHDVSAAQAAAHKLAHLAQHDTLTDLPNRSLLNDRMTQAISLAQRHRTSLAVLYLDLDRFKLINDSLGHLVGDRLLESVATRLSASVRESDTVSRLGGDEFVVLLPAVAHAQDAAVCAEKLLRTLRTQYLVDGHELHVTASIGIALYPGDGTEVEVLLRNADSAMYEAKSRGRNSYQFYRADLNARASERQLMESGLRHAIERAELELHYQPIVNLAGRGVAGVEALIRWRHATLGMVSTSQLVAVAEESGLIVPIGRWVLREACRQAVAWQAAGLSVPRLAVNISAVELRMPDFAEGVAAILRETGFDGHLLELELTETFLMQDTRSTALVLAELKKLGLRLALDDFGTGYSSLSYVRRFPIDTLKVDQSFVRDLNTDPDDASVVSAVINMGKSLQMRVVAEGVETAQQLAFLEAQGCHEAQGFHFGRPLTAAACTAFLRRANCMRQPAVAAALDVPACAEL